MSDIAMRIVLSTLGASSVVSSIKSIGAALGSGNLGGALVAAGKLATETAVVVGVASVKAAGTFQSALTTLSTGAGESTKNLQMVGNGILNIANQTGTTTAQLTAGMFQIESSGQHGASGLQVLANAARGAKVGNADLGTVSNATTTIMSDFGIKASNSAVAVNTLVAITANGKTTMDQLAGSLSNILPTASAAGVSLNDTAAAMATMTGEGIPAAQASTYLRQTIIGIEAPTKAAASAMQNVGLSSTSVANEMKKSLPGALQMITDAVGKKFPVGSAAYVSALKDISGGSKTMQGMLDLTGTHLATFKSNVTNIADAVKNGGNSINGWALVQQNFNQKLAQGKEIVETLGIRLGQILLPAVTGVMDHVLPLASSFSNLLTSTKPLEPVISQVSGMLGIMKTNWQGLAPVIAPAIQAFQKFGTLMSGQLPGAITQFMFVLNDINSVVVIVAGAISGWISPALSILGQIFKGVMEAMVPIQNAIQGQLLPALQNLVSAIAPIITHILQWIANSGIITPLLHGLGVTIGIIVTVISHLISGLASVIKFFTQTQLGVSILQAVFVAIGIVIGIIAIVVLPGLIAGFVATAISAIATGISIALAFLPITLIVLGIIAIITLVILAIKNWGAIVGVLKAAWSSVAAGIWKDITQAFGAAGQWFQDKFKQAGDGIKKGFGAIGGWFTQQGTNLKNTASNIGKGVVSGFQWMYAHNTYFKAMVDAISKVASAFGNWLSQKWTDIKNDATKIWTSVTSFISGLWTKLSLDAKIIFSAVSEVISNIFNTLGGWLHTFWTDELAGLSNIWHGLTNIAQNVWNSVTGVFKNAWGGISNALSGIWTNLSGWFNNLKDQALKWGENLINSVAQGIRNAAGAVGDAASSVASNIEKFLGFHSPAKAGPGSHLLEWPKNMLAAYGQSLKAAIPTLQTSLNAVMTPIASALSGQNGVPHPAVSPVTTSATSGQPINVFNITLNGVIGNKNDIATWLEKDLSQKLNNAGRLSTTRSGGRAS